VSSLDANQQNLAFHPWQNAERKIWHFIPKERTGLRWNQLNEQQQILFKAALKDYMSQMGLDKSFQIMQLEELVRIMENRPVGDTKRDPTKYVINFWGLPGEDFWTFRYEGHHVSLTFTGMKDNIISATPFFMGTNPAIALTGPQKGHEVLPQEQALARAFVNSLDDVQKSKAIVTNTAPNELLTAAESVAPPLDDNGLSFLEMSSSQQSDFVALIDVYMNRFSETVQSTIVKAWKKNDWKDYKFAWAGGLKVGDGHYYRIKGPDMLIEYCNTQGDANHIHTSVRDYKNDYGEDLLRSHLKAHH